MSSYGPPPSSPPPAYPPPVSGPQKSGPNKALMAALAGVGGLLVVLIVLVVVLLANGGSNDDSAQPAVPSASAPESSAPASPAPTSTTYEPPTVHLKKSDITTEVKVTSKQCFGSAGCNVQYRVGLGYNGSNSDTLDGSYDVTFRVVGDESQTTDTLTVNKHLRYTPASEFGSTPSSSTELKAVIVSVKPSGTF